ncbi:hypothetical protein PCANC_21908 [Puccinia coronata f. sp. avenae]|uniref:Thiamine pyrophosphokinase n=1 Tax=Puccinia coronata f. sp. avenae TaxID=200324 RepID=A0A2N5S503_9BASI|nr:hypothetical protein PCANC_25676 [Puccinia coronata f. sp. avenae]PLW33814.1 hypothetical protein PCANC_21908 [Puccinia coronata f. sp. avenae]PLW38181.1 hypothetical protein PCASD_09481 [Puccinia coronata f. sp. avenae]
MQRAGPGQGRAWSAVHARLLFPRGPVLYDGEATRRNHKMTERRWSGPFAHELEKKSYLVILNTAIKLGPDGGPNRVFELLWAGAARRICADGGANRLYDYCMASAATGPDTRQQPPRILVPDHITGDLDSIRPQVKQFFEQSPAQISHHQDQDSTDFGKCLALIDAIEGRSDSNNLYHHHSTGLLLIHGGLTGRLDQTIHTLHVLLSPLRAPSASPVHGLPETWVVDTDGGSMACALPGGVKHLLHVPVSWRQGGSPLTCGILPIGVNQTTLTTKGLKWNLDRAQSSMTGLLSTSNHVLPETEVVEVESDESVIWTIEIPSSAM